MKMYASPAHYERQSETSNASMARAVFRMMSEVPAKTAEAEAISKELKKRGFKFVGPTMIYAMMQSAGALPLQFARPCIECHLMAGYV